MAITVDPIPSSLTKKPSVSPSTQPSLVAVLIDELKLISDEEVELEKLVKSSDSGLDEVIQFDSLCSVLIPETFLPCGISTADVMAVNPVYHIDLGTLQDEHTVVTGSKSINLNKLDTTIFYDDSPKAQMDGGAGVSKFNDVPIESLCPNAQHLLYIANGNDLTEIQGSIDVASDLEFYIYIYIYISFFGKANYHCPCFSC